MKEWTIDTNVLYKVAEEYDYDALEFLVSVRGKHMVVFDYDGHIMEEYRKCLNKTRNRYLVKWFNKVQGENRCVWYSSSLRSQHKQALLNMKFDPSDLPFVGVASRSKDKLLVSEDSDYTSTVRRYLGDRLNVHVLSIQQGRTIVAQDP
jgi:hypothetical protein